jgi:hypothetical protein
MIAGLWGISAFQTIGLGIAIVSVGAAGWGGTIAIRQLRASKRAAQLQAVVATIELVSNPASMIARRWVLVCEPWLSKVSSYESLSAIEQQHFQEVCRTWDRVGLMVEHKLLNEQIALDMWGFTIERTHIILTGIISDRRNPQSGNNPKFAHNFSNLSTLAATHNTKVGNAPPNRDA